jgi:predicted Rossmann-fold nucleotide-binding protein
LYDSKFWQGFIDWLHYTVAARNYIAVDDFNLLRVCDDPDQRGGNGAAVVHQTGSRREKAMGHNNGASL